MSRPVIQVKRVAYLSSRVVVPPQRTNLVLTSYILLDQRSTLHLPEATTYPDVEFDVFIRDRLHVETDRRDRRD